MSIYVSRDGRQAGPFEKAQLIDYVRSGVYSRDDFAWQEGLEDWVALGALLPAIPPPPPPRKKTEPVTAEPFTEKRLLPILILWLVLGSLGAHHFYAENVGRGIAYLFCFLIGAVGILTGEMGVFAPIAWILLSVGLIADLIRMCTGNFTDGDGKPITRWS